MIIDKENLFREYLSSGINLFAGAGFSVLAKSKTYDKQGKVVDKILPVGSELADELISKFDLQGFNSFPLPKLISVINRTKRDDFNTYLKERFTVSQYDILYSSILSINIKAIFTTNIDDLFSKIYSDCSRKYLYDVTLRGGEGNENSVSFFPLHGCVSHSDVDYKFTTEELVTAFGKDPDLFHFLSKKIQNIPTLFVGYSLEDSGVIEALSDDVSQGRFSSSKWIQLRSDDPAKKEYFRALGFNIIIGTTEEILQYFRNFQAESGLIVSRVTKDLFPTYHVPASAEVRVRPVFDFFCGDEPEWCDVYNNAIYRTSHFESLRNEISSGEHVFFTGIPGSGKSTLLRQLAVSSYANNTHKIFLRLVSIEEVEWIKKQLNGERCLVFLDDFSDDIESLNVLLGQTGIQVVGCCREFVFDQIYHLVRGKAHKVINVSNLKDQDIQAVFDRIPPAMRKSERIHKSMKDADQTTSFFELIELNVKIPSLKKRIQDVLRQLKQDDEQLYLSIIAIAYVHACGIVMTTDMLHAFLRPLKVPIEDISYIFEDLGSMLYEYEGEFSDSQQENMRIRSKLMAETLISIVDSEDFRKVLEVFNLEVSPYRITRFDVFKRRAFDERFVTKAFQNWSDGLKFYESASNRDNSASLLQQCALYLSKKDQSKLAFEWIDKARLKHPRSFSIKNSHAIILFRANIGLVHSDEKVAYLLKSSMDMLQECYRSDKRKIYHACTYAEQALELHRATVKEARDYLDVAKKWLESENISSSSKAKYLLSCLKKYV